MDVSGQTDDPALLGERSQRRLADPERRVGREPKASFGIEALDGASVLAFSVIVIGLMAALNPALQSDPWAVAGWTVLAFALSYLLQAGTLLLTRRGPLHPSKGSAVPRVV